MMPGLFQPAAARTLFVLGLLTLPALVFQDQALYRALNAALYLGLVLASGQRIRLLPPLLLLASVTAAALLTPYGKVLFSVWGWPITRGALLMGLSRGALLLGLFYLSRFSVLPGVDLPGRLGGGIAKVFFYFERFCDNRAALSIKDLPASLDRLLLAVSASDSPAQAGPGPSRGHRPAPPLWLALAAPLGCWLLLLLDKLG